MIHNSYDFSMSEASSVAKIDQDQNPSWINLKSLKDVIRMSSDRVLHSDHRSKFLIEKPSTAMKIISNDQDEMLAPAVTHIDTPLYNNQNFEIENIMKEQC